MEDSRHKTTTYKISNDPEFLNEQNNITPEIQMVLENLQPAMEKGGNHLVKKINNLCQQYPKVPTFKNVLTNLYMLNGEYDKAYEANRRLLKEHPDYLFGKINLANEYLEKEQIEIIPKILGEAMEIHDLYPERNEFHIEEVMAFNLTAVYYFLAVGNDDEANRRCELMEELDSDHPNSLKARIVTLEWEKEVLQEIYGGLKKELQIKEHRSTLQTTVPPTFNFPEEMQWLYENGPDIAVEKTNQILGLERSPLISDLNAVLNDSIVRFDFFLEKEENEGYNKNEFDFPIHALLLLAELKAEEAIDQILEVFKQDDEYNEFWFADYMYDVGMGAIFWCGKLQTDKLLDFLKLSGLNGYSKNFVSSAVIKIPKFSSERRQEILDWNRELLNFHIEKAKDEDFLDTEYLGFLIADLTDAGFHELLPEIEQLFNMEVVELWICGDYQAVKKDIYEEKHSIGELHPIQTNIYEKYRELESFSEEEKPYASANFDDDTYDSDASYAPWEYQEPIVKPKKVGRNDPCPCGSGKKYKKCCLNKG